MTKNEAVPLRKGDEIATVEPTAIAPTTGPPDINRLMEIALTQGPEGVASLKELVGLQERMEDRAAEKAFSRAMLGFQNSCPTVRKNKPGYKDRYRYAPLDYIKATIAPHLERQGLSYSWESDPEVPERMLRFYTIVRHVDGHSVRFKGALYPCETKTDMMTPQQVVGATEMYAKRQGLVGALGITTGDEDTDAQQAETKFITEEQVATLDALIDETGADRKAFLKFSKADQIAHIPQSQYRKLVHMLESKRGQS